MVSTVMHTHHWSLEMCTLWGVMFVFRPVSENYPPKKVEVKASGRGKYLTGMS